MPGAESRPLIIDISLPIAPHMVVWPGDPPVECRPVSTLEADGVQVSHLSFSTHTGTHVDAPRHFIPGGRTIDQLDLGALLGWCQVIEVMKTTGHVSQADLEAVTRVPGARVLLKTRNSLAGERATFSSDFAALEASAADYLCEHGVCLVGIDGPSIDAWESRDFLCHKRLLAADIIVVENLRLHHVMPGRYGLIAVPLKLTGGDGCPIRALLTKAASCEDPEDRGAEAGCPPF